MKHDQELELQMAERAAQIMEAKNERLRKHVAALKRMEDLYDENNALMKQLEELKKRLDALETKQ